MALFYFLKHLGALTWCKNTNEAVLLTKEAITKRAALKSVKILCFLYILTILPFT